MIKDTAEYILYHITKDSIYSSGVFDWCYDRDINVSELNEFIYLVEEMINELEEN